MTAIGFIFPGQGSQKVGMGRDWAEAVPEVRHTFEEADDALGVHLSRLCWEGPEDELNLTINTQPALLACSIAILRVAQAQADLDAVAFAGHSLGEYSALVAAGSLDFGDALRLVRERGRFMQQAVPLGEGAMAAIIGLSVEHIVELTEQAKRNGEVCGLANLNGELQTVIAGHSRPIEETVGLAKAAKAKKAVVLPVSAPFHSPLMAPARERLTPLLGDTAFRAPGQPVVCNVDARPVTDGDTARDALIRQVDAPVRWVECATCMAEELGVGTFLEIGPGKVLTGMTRRIVDGSSCTSLQDPKSLDRYLSKSDGGSGDD